MDTDLGRKTAADMQIAELIIESDSKSQLTLGSESRKKDNRCTGKTMMAESK